MAKTDATIREQAEKLFIESGGTLKNRALAEMVGAPEKSISVWKSRYKWAQKIRGSTTKSTTKNEGEKKPRRQAAKDGVKEIARKRGGQPGNKNSVGNRGNLQTGEYSHFLTDILSAQEVELLQNHMDRPAMEEVKEQIALLRIRQRQTLLKLKEIAERGMSEAAVRRLNERMPVAEFVETDGRVVKQIVDKIVETEVEFKSHDEFSAYVKLSEAFDRNAERIIKATKLLHDIQVDAIRVEQMTLQMAESKLRLESLQKDKESSASAVDAWKTQLLEVVERRKRKNTSTD